MPLSFLVATDLSPRADRAVSRAFDLAQSHGATLTLLYVIDDAMPEEMAREMQKAAGPKLARFAESRRGAEGVAHIEKAEIGDPCAVIARAAEETGADLLILGLHRDRPFQDLIHETTMERIVRTTSQPVLLVRDPMDHPYATVLSAVDFSPASTAALRLAATLVPQAKLHAVHALHIPYRGFMGVGGRAETALPFRHEAESMREEWRKAGALPDALGEVEIVEGAARSVLTAKIAELRPDLLTVGAHGRAGAAPALLGSLANDLMRNPPCDLLIAR
ncbi:MAG: universal stress protein [Paracoccaceae bacterium]